MPSLSGIPITWNSSIDTAPLEVLSDTLSIIRTVTVGSGVTPDLLTPSKRILMGARGLRNNISLPPVGNFTPPRERNRNIRRRSMRSRHDHKRNVSRRSQLTQFLSSYFRFCNRCKNDDRRGFFFGNSTDGNFGRSGSSKSKPLFAELISCSLAEPFGSLPMC